MNLFKIAKTVVALAAANPKEAAAIARFVKKAVKDRKKRAPEA